MIAVISTIAVMPTSVGIGGLTIFAATTGTDKNVAFAIDNETGTLTITSRKGITKTDNSKSSSATYLPTWTRNYSDQITNICSATILQK